MGRNRELLPAGFDMYALTPRISEAIIVFIANHGGEFPPESGPGRHSIKNAFVAMIEGRNTPKEVSPSGPDAKLQRRQWNKNHCPKSRR